MGKVFIDEDKFDNVSSFLLKHDNGQWFTIKFEENGVISIEIDNDLFEITYSAYTNKIKLST